MTSVTLARPLLLASASPRRAELLQQLAVPFQVVPGSYEEPPPSPGVDILAYLRHTALEKARSVAPALPPAPVVILGADTLVLAPGGQACLRGEPVEVMGKPRDPDDALRMLRVLSGRTHTVASAFALLRHPEGEAVCEVVETRVRFRTVTEREIAAYLATGEPLDKAGAYGIQGRGAVLIDGIDGDYYTVVGLPLARLWQQLQPYLR